MKNLVQIAGEPALMIVPHKSAMYIPHHCPGMENLLTAAMTEMAAMALKILHGIFLQETQ